MALYARQALLVAYIALGALLGPWALDLVSDPALIADIANVGILFLLFLLGLNLEPAELRKLFREAIVVTAASSAAFALVGAAIAYAFGFAPLDCLLIGATMMFSSTIIALKLLPTSALHHQRMGELIVSILLLQDMLAIGVLLALKSFGNPDNLISETLLLLFGLPALAAVAWFLATRVLTALFLRFDQIQEYLFLVAIGWCLGLAQLATVVGLSHEVGAFIAGVTLATSPDRPLHRREPQADPRLLPRAVLLRSRERASTSDGCPTCCCRRWCSPGSRSRVKPIVFRKLLERERETARMAAETGARLAQISEFSLLIVVVAQNFSLMSERAALLVQSATILSFIGSSYWIVRRYPTPIATDARLRRD